MSQNQSYYWCTSRHNVYLKRRAKFHLLMALISVLVFSTVCLAEMTPDFKEDKAKNLLQTKIGADDMKFPKVEVVNSAGDEAPNSEATKEDIKVQAGFIDAFTASISVILFTELGDKTFFIAAIMAMRHPRLIVFSGAIFALALMTVLSVVFGMAATIIPKIYTYYISTALFAIFGLKMVYDGYIMKSTDAQEEMEEVQSDLRKREDELLRGSQGRPEDPDTKRKNSNSDKEDDADEVSSAGAATTATEISSTKNSRTLISHFQRKILKRNNFNNTIVNANTRENGSDDAEETAGIKETDAFLKKGSGDGVEILRMSTFHSSPGLTTVSVNPLTECDDFRFNNENNHKNKNAILVAQRDGACITPMVHSASAMVLCSNNNNNNNTNNSTSATVPQALKRNVSNASLENGATSSIQNDLNHPNLNSTVSQARNGLKQIGGSKKRLERVSAPLVQDAESGVVRKNTKRSATYLTTRVFMQAFTMTFLAEWGDRSQLTTIILAASKDVYGVIVGGILGHSICTGLAVIGGRMVAAKISVRVVTIMGGIVFLGFAVYALICKPDDL